MLSVKHPKKTSCKWNILHEAEYDKQQSTRILVSIRIRQTAITGKYYRVRQTAVTAGEVLGYDYNAANKYYDTTIKLQLLISISIRQ